MPKHKHKNISEEDKCQRPYRVECTGSLPNSEVKRRRARLVLGWGTAREDLRVLLAFCVFLPVCLLALRSINLRAQHTQQETEALRVAPSYQSCLRKPL